MDNNAELITGINRMRETTIAILLGLKQVIHAYQKGYFKNLDLSSINHSVFKIYDECKRMDDDLEKYSETRDSFYGDLTNTKLKRVK